MAKRERLGEILMKAGLLKQEGLDRALNEQERWGGPLGRYLVQMELVTEETLVRALSAQFKLPAVALDPPKLALPIAKRIPREVCERNRLVCFRFDESTNSVDVAMADPASLDAVDDVRVATRCNVRPFFAAPSAIDASIRHVFYGDAHQGGTIDLSPSSSLREDVGSGEFSERARGGAKPVSPPPPPPVAGVLPGAGGVRLPGSPREGTDEQFHVTMDLPQQSANDSDALRARVEALEKALARNHKVLRGVLDLLVKRSLLAPEERATLLTKA
ncbi:MAG: hypothetical protein JRH20_12330 [Deltaproteobacteria bacterium]|nr:hypothetical protein [Deltaproteobacteria bacterium]